jgi:hypothetical protein
LKTCAKCRVAKPLDQFSKAKTKSGVRARCKPCSTEDYNEYIARVDPDEHAAKRRASKYKSRFKLTIAEVEAMFASVGERCESCGSHRDDTFNGVLVLDHDHSCCPGERTCGKCIRGVMCTKCNIALGALGDNPVFAARLAEYARRITWPNMVDIENQLSPPR